MQFKSLLRASVGVLPPLCILHCTGFKANPGRFSQNIPDRRPISIAPAQSTYAGPQRVPGSFAAPGPDSASATREPTASFTSSGSTFLPAARRATRAPVTPVGPHCFIRRPTWCNTCRSIAATSYLFLLAHLQPQKLHAPVPALLRPRCPRRDLGTCQRLRCTQLPPGRTSLKNILPSGIPPPANRQVRTAPESPLVGSSCLTHPGTFTPTAAPVPGEQPGDPAVSRVSLCQSSPSAAGAVTGRLPARRACSPPRRR